MLPFTVDEFFGVFRRYNETVWPAQPGLLMLAVAALGLTVRGRRNDHRWVSGILAVLWLWMAVVYHLTFFLAVNPAAWVFAIAFALQGLLLANHARRPISTVDAPGTRMGFSKVVSTMLLAYALVGYPLVGWAVGHRYPALPTFGVPCPTTIFTLGILAWRAATVRWHLLIIPVAWAALGFSAAARLGVVEDWGLPAAAALCVVAIGLDRRRHPAGYATSSAA